METKAVISHADFKPYRALAAAVMLDAHNTLSRSAWTQVAHNRTQPS